MPLTELVIARRIVVNHQVLFYSSAQVFIPINVYTHAVCLILFYI